MIIERWQISCAYGILLCHYNPKPRVQQSAQSDFFSRQVVRKAKDFFMSWRQWIHLSWASEESPLTLSNPSIVQLQLGMILTDCWLFVEDTGHLKFCGCKLYLEPQITCRLVDQTRMAPPAAPWGYRPDPLFQNNENCLFVFKITEIIWFLYHSIFPNLSRSWHRCFPSFQRQMFIYIDFIYTWTFTCKSMGSMLVIDIFKWISRLKRVFCNWYR